MRSSPCDPDVPKCPPTAKGLSGILPSPNGDRLLGTREQILTLQGAPDAHPLVQWTEEARYTWTDPDHLLGLLDVMAKLPVDELWHSGFTRDHPLMRRLLDLAVKKNVRMRTARELAPAQQFGDTRVEILTPFPEDGSAIYEELSPNENSLTLRVVHGADSALWPGDLEAWGERYLMRDGAPLQSTIHKAGHHGSKTSSTQPFVDKVAPEIVVFPTGPDNQWGFPHAEVVERWRQTGARLYDTAQHGEITFFLTGTGVEVHPFRVPEPLQGWAGE